MNGNENTAHIFEWIFHVFEWIFHVGVIAEGRLGYWRIAIDALRNTHSFGSKS